jgi:hypothetical protein
MIKKGIWILGFLILLFLLTVDRLVGMFFEPRLEHALTDLFGMSVSVQGLHIHPLFGHAAASRLTFINQPEFAQGPHLDVRGIKFDIDFLALRENKVRIRKLYLNRPFYLIDRIATEQGPKNNVKTWVQHIKQKMRANKSAQAPWEDSQTKAWEVRIDKIQIGQGTFIFHDRSRKESERKFVFQNLEGFLQGFKWPTEDPSDLVQEVKIRGTLGEQYPAPFWIEGHANFATSHVSFDLDGLIEEGNVLGHRQLWEGLPIEVVGGQFEFKAHVVCLQRALESENELALKSMRVKPGPATTDKIWGYPLKAWVAFIQNQKRIDLKIPVRGDITDPQFDFPQAFRAAFQKALRERTKSGLKLLTQGAEKLATQTQQIVLETPTKLVNSLGKLTSLGKSQNKVD